MSNHNAAAHLRAAMPEQDSRRLLEREAETRFALKGGQIASEAPPDNAPGPLLYMAGGRAWIAQAIDVATAWKLDAVLTREPPLVPGRPPLAAALYLEMLGAETGHAGLSFRLPHATPQPGGSPTIASNTPGGAGVGGPVDP